MNSLTINVIFQATCAFFGLILLFWFLFRCYCMYQRRRKHLSELRHELNSSRRIPGLRDRNIPVSHPILVYQQPSTSFLPTLQTPSSLAAAANQALIPSAPPLSVNQPSTVVSESVTYQLSNMSHNFRNDKLNGNASNGQCLPRYSQVTSMQIPPPSYSV